MYRKGFILLLLFFIILASCNKKLIPDKPFLSKTNFSLDSLPESEVSIPIQVNLKPFYKLAEKNVDTVFSSPNWPEDWVNIDCATRYKYHFRRSPMQITSNIQSVNMSFTGYYKIIGTTRICLGNTVVSPWTPPCRCGFEEGERRVKVKFVNSVSVYPDYKIKLNIQWQEPEPLDKCTVCFFGADITNNVIKGLKDELSFAKKAIEDSFGVLDIKNQVQQVWNKLTPSYNIFGLGWLQINPQKFKLTNYYFKNDSLNLLLGMTARPVIRFEKTADLRTLIPDLDYSLSKPGFNIFLDAILNYDSLSNILNTKIKGQQFEFKKGSITKTVIVDDCRIYGTGNENLIIKMSFSGSNTGIVYFTGKPVYNVKDRTIEIRDIDFDVKTRNFLMKKAAWMFNRKITSQIASYSKYNLSGYIDTAKTLINGQLNQQWMKGVSNAGTINELKIDGIYPLSEYLIIRSNASGSLVIKVDSIDF
jgi:Domain of unknown function (DUF4403)